MPVFRMIVRRTHDARGKLDTDDIDAGLGWVAGDYGSLYAMAAGHILPLDLLGRHPHKSLGISLCIRRQEHEWGQKCQACGNDDSRTIHCGLLKFRSSRPGI